MKQNLPDTANVNFSSNNYIQNDNHLKMKGGKNG